jgi:hypothetical protein
MPITVNWDDEAQSIIRLNVSPYTWDEFHSAFGEAFALAQTAPHRIDFIFNVPNSIRTPSANYLTHLREEFARVPANAGIFVQSGGSQFGKLIASLFANMVGWNRRILFVNSVQAAREKIAQARAADSEIADVYAVIR